jgi:septal ring factor EnvC (AmiA/AmiB activator)
MRYTRFITFTALILCVSAWGQTSKIKQLEIQRKKALLEIENTNKLLIDTKKISQNLLTRIKLISNQIDSRKQVVSLLEQEANALAVQQDITRKEIEVLEKELKGKQKNYAKAINGMLYRKQSENKLLYVLSGKSWAESMRRMRYLKEYSEWRSKEADAIRTKAQLLHEKKNDLEQQRKSKIILINQKDSEQQKLQKEENTHRQEVNEAQQKQKELQGILAQKKRQADQLNQQIERLIAEEVARQEREEQRLAEEKARQLAAKQKAEREAQQREQQSKPKETQPKKKKKGELEPKKEDSKPRESAPAEQGSRTEKLLAEASSENMSLSNNFASNKGKLPVPVTGRYSIVSGFGQHQHSQYVTTNSNGIDIQTQAGSEARAAFGGEVSRVVAFPGFNNCIIIRHGNYYTFYGNIQSVFVRVGQKVKTGQSLGKIFTDPDSGITQMHFQLWKGTNKQDPSPWIRR